MLEKEIETNILNFLELLPECFAWKNNNFGTYGAHRKAKSRFLPNGVPDILGIYKGQFLAIEVKQPKKKLSPEQIEFINNIKIQGGIAFRADCLTDVIEGMGLDEEKYLN